MKAVVLEVRDGVAAVLREDGRIEKISRTCNVGETIEISEAASVVKPRNKKTVKVVIGAVAAAAAVAITVGSAGAYNFYNNVAYAYVSLDSDASLEYVLNRVNKVIDVNAINDDAKEIAEAVKAENVKGKSLTGALELTGEVMKEKGYLSEDDNYVLIGITSPDDDTFTKLEAQANESFKEEDGKNVTLEIERVDEESRKKASDLGISGGRFEEIRKVEAKDQADDGGAEPDREVVDKYDNHSIKDLMEAGRRPEENAPGGEDKEPDADDKRQEPAADDKMQEPAQDNGRGEPAPDNNREQQAPAGGENPDRKNF